MPEVKWVMTIASVDDEHVQCIGVFPTADGKGTHSHTGPRFLRGEALWKGVPQVGDKVIAYEDGTHVHEPRVPR